jgi:hypothetical protein
VFPATPAPKFFEVFVVEVGGWAFHSFWSPVGCRADRSNLISLPAVDFLCFYFTLYSVAVAPPVDFTFSVLILASFVGQIILHWSFVVTSEMHQ